MTPRLSNSKKWTAFPADFVTQIRTAFEENFRPALGEAELVIEGRIYTNEILLRVGYLEKDRLQQNNFEISIEYKQDNAVDRIHEAIDAAASLMAEFIESDGELELPRTWKEITFDNLKVYCQYSTVNSKLEAEADRLLGLDESTLVHNAGEDEELESDDLPPSDKSKLH